MKTRITIATVFIVFVLTFCAKAATEVVKISAFPNTATLNASDLFLITVPGVTNRNINWSQLRDQIGTNGSGTVVMSNAYITNLFLTEIVTNYFLFNTNIFITNSVNNAYVSNYFVTNIFAGNTYISNFFTTNSILYETNIYNYSTNLTVTNFYAGDTFVSNYFNTNIFNSPNTYISNFFLTNIYNTVNISSNYTFQYSLNPTNLTMYGHTFMLGYEGDPNPTLILLGQTNEIFIDAGLGIINLSGQYFGASYQTEEFDWGGPTNSINPNAGDFFFSTFTPCSITGFDGPLPSPAHSWSGLLTITNAASTNILLTLPAGMTIPERTNQVAISNASRGMISMKWSHRSGTNGVFRQF